MSDDAPDLELDAVSKRFERDTSERAAADAAPAGALSDVSFDVARGELLALVGPSGCGKSTTLRIIAGLEHADAGDVRIAGRSVRAVPPQDRDVAMVFQGYALYPQMTVRENIEFPLRMRRMDARERTRRADEAAEMLRLGALMDRLPAELSGGERQRVAMGRAIVRRPRVFLFDEPLSNLDAALRQELRIEIGALVRDLGVTSVYVTHDQVEAMTLGDRICVMKKGRVQQIAPPRELYERPGNAFVASFLGSPRMNLIPGTAEAGALACGPFRLATAPSTAAGRARGDVIVGVRPEDVLVERDESEGAVRFEVALAEPLGAETHLVLRAGALSVRARVPGFDPRAPGEAVFVRLEGTRVHLFEAGEEGARLA